MSGISSGKEVAMISRNSTGEISLNMFDRSKKTAARVGGSPCCSLLVIYFFNCELDGVDDGGASLRDSMGEIIR